MSSAKKFDAGKAQLSLLPKVAIEAEAAVLAFGAEKYGRGNWQGGMAWSRMLDACLRHVFAFASGEDCDPETGITHLAHARCCLGFLIDYQQRHPELDDRMKDKKDCYTIDMFREHALTNIPRDRRFNWKTQPSCLDAALERQAIEHGSSFGDNPTFPENRMENRIL